MAFSPDPVTGLRKKSGGRQKGTMNASTSARQAAMHRVNHALAGMGRDQLSGLQLLQEVLRHADTPLDVKIQCAGLLTKHESPAASEQNYVAIMPWPVKDLNEWRKMYMSVAPDADSNEAARLEGIAKSALENDKGRTSPADNAPWLRNDKEEIGF
jgi:hypothetical protein